MGRSLKAISCAMHDHLQWLPQDASFKSCLALISGRPMMRLSLFADTDVSAKLTLWLLAAYLLPAVI
ncbi:hypothetical protein PS645_01879 [Pseudomonas fluorescens]|uniref:Uncharacterized protein n=2 Tax=Pseudomonas fluorescens TaxID=294 RepID=A0A5E6RYB8_PSEFL|nr:hypothetical protein PS645_01879 [Pseudomonas fluorescens]